LAEAATGCRRTWFRETGRVKILKEKNLGKSNKPFSQRWCLKQVLPFGFRTCTQHKLLIGHQKAKPVTGLMIKNAQNCNPQLTGAKTLRATTLQTAAKLKTATLQDPALHKKERTKRRHFHKPERNQRIARKTTKSNSTSRRSKLVIHS
jgi:hypothetical protein